MIPRPRAWCWAAAAIVVTFVPSLTFVTAADAQAAPNIEVVEQTAYVHRGEKYSITVKITDAAPTDRVAIAVGRVSSSGTRVRQTRADLRHVDRPAEMLAGNVVGLFLLAICSTTQVNDQCASLEPGVWPVAIGISPANEPRKPKQAIMTELVVVPDSGAVLTTPPLAVTIVVPLTAKPALRPDQEVRLDSLDRNRLRTLADRIEALPSVVLAVSPQLLGALELSSVPEDRALLDRLRQLAATREVLALPYSNVDEEAWRAAGLTDELKDQFQVGQDTIRRVLKVEPTQGTTIVDPSATTDTLTMLSELGTSAFVFNESQLDALPGTGWSTPPTKRFDIRGARGTGVSVDPELRRLFAGDSILNAHRLLADLSAAYFDVANARDVTARDERHGVVVLVPDDWSTSTQFLTVISTALQSNPILRTATFTSIFNLPPSGTESDTTAATPAQGVLTRSLRPELPKALGNYPTALRDATARLNSFSGLLSNSDGHTTPLRELLLVSGDDRLDPSERDAYLNQVIQTVERGSRGVTITGTLRVTLTARQDTFPIIIENDPANPKLKVVVELRSDPRLDFPGSPIPYELVPGPNRLDVRVRSRTPGSFPVDVVVRSPDGVITLATARYKIRSLALSGVGLGISIAALAVLVTWWVRHHRSAKRAKIAHQLTGAA
ncbi:MAG: hypothetical protein E6G39_01840 [Actinobacteria bacterium]|nr:MAG: hypothetical protein E6G39_01840 [Actinomycetota bacterium]